MKKRPKVIRKWPIAQIVQQVRGSYLLLISKHRTSYIIFLLYDIHFTGKHESNKLNELLSTV